MDKLWGSASNRALGTSSVSGARSRVALAAAILGSAALVAVALTPSAGRSNRATAAVAPATPRPMAAQHAAAPALAQTADQGVRRFTGPVGADLSHALVAAGVPEQQGREYVALLARAIPLADGLSVDDRFDVIVERHEDGSFGQLLYAGMDRVARADVELLKWTDGRHVIWVNADGVGGDSSSGMLRPVAGRISSGFGQRFHPILGYERFHAGVDLAAASGTPIAAAADGQVVSAGWRGGYGQAVSIAHSGGVDTLYGHMSRIAVRAGELVHRGEVIGYVGSTGLATGPHLHFEVRRNGRPVDPLTVKLGSGPAQLEGAKLIAFRDELRKVLLDSSPAG